MAKRLLAVGYYGVVERKEFFSRLFDRKDWKNWNVLFLDHTHRPNSRSRPDFFPAFFFQHDNYIRDGIWILKAGIRMFISCPRVSIEGLILDYYVARRKEGFRYSIFRAAFLVLRGFGTVSAKLIYGRSLGLEVGEADCVALFGSNFPTQRLFQAHCDRVGAKLVMVEHGSLAGMIHFSPESVTYGLYPIRCSEKFRALPISESDIEQGKRFLENIARKRIDQKPQRVDQTLLEKLRSSDKKVLLVPGIGNVGGGLFPRMSDSSKKVSPFFRSNDQLLKAVVEKARRNDWQVVYKPHPNLVGNRLKFTEDETLILCDECSIPDLIEECDCIVCLGTKVSQTALSLGKPVVLLGRYSLSGMGCCYEIGGKEELEVKLREAIEAGVTESQENAYLEYAARELKYCLFQYQSFTESKFGRGMEELSTSLKSYFEDYGESMGERFAHPLIAARES